MHDPGPAFRSLHVRGDPFILANAWDVGSARMLSALGAKAIGTSSAAFGFTIGQPDGTVTRDEALAHAETMVRATALPVSGDFENGYGDAPETVAETVRLACEVGLAGISIEDIARPSGRPYDRALAVERIRAAVDAARALPRDFVLVARADGIMTGDYDLAEALARLRAFEEAGADCLYAPLPKSWEDLCEIVSATKLPVNVLVAGQFASYAVEDFARIGAARLSLGSTLARLTHRMIHDAATLMFEDGSFSKLKKTISGDAVDRMLRGEA